MDLPPLLATGAGAVIALAGTLLADVGRDRRQRERDIDLVRRSTNVDFALALSAAHAGLREVRESSAEAEVRRAAVWRAVDEAGLYGARERLLMTATAPLVKAADPLSLFPPWRRPGLRRPKESHTTSVGSRNESDNPGASTEAWPGTGHRVNETK